MLPPATIAALPSTRAIPPIATCSMSLIPFAPFLLLPFRAVPEIMVIVRNHYLPRFILCLILLAAFSPLRGEQPPLHSHREFKIGVLASLTGSWSSLGHNTVAALEIAADQLAADAKAQHGGYRFHLFVRDTQLDPAKALEAIQDLDKRGVQIVIGPQSSAEVAMIKPYADAHNILVISQGSTASSLAIPGDNIFRFCPNDMREAEAIVALMRHDGIRTIVPLWRNDAGNNGLHDSVKADFENLGGTVTSGYQYQPTTTDFSAATSSVASQIGALLIAGADPNSVAIYLAAFDEVVGVFHSAANNSILSSTHWYGSDGVALSAALTGDATGAAFAVSAGYPNPTFGLPDALQSSWQPVANAIEARTGITPDAFALSTYDALFVVGRALRAAGDLKDFASFKAAFVNAADAYSGVTGSTALDAAGDRLSADFDFWAVRPVNGSYAWVRIGTYTNGTLSLF
jgi:branched-chain amino acid transport system substrate-binding protein